MHQQHFNTAPGATFCCIAHCKSALAGCPRYDKMLLPLVMSLEFCHWFFSTRVNVVHIYWWPLQASKIRGIVIQGTLRAVLCRILGSACSPVTAFTCNVFHIPSCLCHTSFCLHRPSGALIFQHLAVQNACYYRTRSPAFSTSQAPAQKLLPSDGKHM